MKNTLYCQCCRMPIAGFDELTSPVTVSQFGPCRPDINLDRVFGGERGEAATFVCPRCKRWPFLTEGDENFVMINGTREKRKEPVRVRVGYQTNAPDEWYHIGAEVKPISGYPVYEKGKKRHGR